MSNGRKGTLHDPETGDLLAEIELPHFTWFRERGLSVWRAHFAVVTEHRDLTQRAMVTLRLADGRQGKAVIKVGQIKGGPTITGTLEGAGPLQ